MQSACLFPKNNPSQLNAHHRWISQCGGNVVYHLCPERLCFLLLSASVCRGGLHPLCSPETKRFESKSEEEGKERALRINIHTSTGGKTWCERRCKPYGTIKPYTSHLVQQAMGVRTRVCSHPPRHSCTAAFLITAPRPALLPCPAQSLCPSGHV